MNPGTLLRLERAGVVMVSRSARVDDALRAAEAAMRGGITSIEVTFSVPNAVAAIERISAEDDAEVTVGAGTVLTLDQARAAVDAGARFLVSPGYDDDVVEFGILNDVLVIPGVFTPSEMMRATSAGCVAIKLFPAATVGPDFVRSVLAPLPELAIIPSGGISSATIADWIRAGCIAAGVGGALSPNGPVDDIVAESIRAEAAACIAAVAAARSELTTSQRKAR